LYDDSDNSNGMATGRSTKVRFLAGTRELSLFHRVQAGSGAYPTSCPVGTGGCVPGVKQQEYEADHSPLSSADVLRMVELYLHSPMCLHSIVINYIHI
jgi:hypothetical protein